MEELISKKDFLELLRFKDNLEYIEKDNSFLSIIAVSDEEITTNLFDFVKGNSPIPIQRYQIYTNANVDLFFKENKTSKNIFFLNITFEKTIQTSLINHFQLFRDYISQYNLKIIFVCSNEFLIELKKNAYDFFSVSQYSYFFNNLNAETLKNLQKADISDNEKEFIILDADLNKYLASNQLDQKILMRKYFNIAELAYKISKLKIALDYFQNSLKIAKEVKIKLYISANLGNIGLIYSDKGNFDKAMKYHKQALEIN
ncbi:MAG: tetratricopeptide repeat protein, partial [Bacteroidota bacterium]|nr:tetratricopeptide repeat protein [Bacteroidota bacterium]